MNIANLCARTRAIAAASVAAIILSACGGGGTPAPAEPITPPPEPTSGKIGILITDMPTQEFSAIKLDVMEARLIGGDDSQVTLFTEPRQIDLLDLTNYSEPVYFETVAAGTYSKLRLILDNLELVSMDGTESWFPSLPGNGKLDLLDQDGFAILPGRTVIIEIDIDANKSIKVTSAGNSGKYQFRPVVKVDIIDGGLPDRLARVEGFVAEIPEEPAGRFVLCHAINVDNCIPVNTGEGTSFFDMEGAGTDFSALMVNDPVVVIGRYSYDDGGEGDIELDALIVEIGGNAVQTKGNVVSEPAEGSFLLQKYDDTSVVVELQDGTKYFDMNGELGPESITLGTDIEVEGVIAPKEAEEDPDVLRAALVFVMADPQDLAIGTILDEPDAATRSFMLAQTEGGDICVNVAEDADILLVDVTASTVTTATFAELAMDQVVDLFGAAPDGAEGCFQAAEVIVEVPPPAGEGT